MSLNRLLRTITIVFDDSCEQQLDWLFIWREVLNLNKARLGTLQAFVMVTGIVVVDGFALGQKCRKRRKLKWY